MATRPKNTGIRRLNEVLQVAADNKLLSGARTEVVRGRMPKALVAKAMAVSGARTNTELIEIALANLAVADDYADWLIAQRGTVPKDIDLEF